MRLASFDIFDTTLIRWCGKPEVVFEQLAERLYPNDKAMSEAFLLWRRQTDYKMSVLKHCKDMTLSEIYSTINHASFKEHTITEMMDMEKAVEADNFMAKSPFLSAGACFRFQYRAVFCMACLLAAYKTEYFLRE